MAANELQRRRSRTGHPSGYGGCRRLVANASARLSRRRSRVRVPSLPLSFLHEMRGCRSSRTLARLSVFCPVRFDVAVDQRVYALVCARQPARVVADRRLDPRMAELSADPLDRRSGRERQGRVRVPPLIERAVLHLRVRERLLPDALAEVREVHHAATRRGEHQATADGSREACESIQRALREPHGAQRLAGLRDRLGRSAECAKNGLISPTRRLDETGRNQVSLRLNRSSPGGCTHPQILRDTCDPAFYEADKGRRPPSRKNPRICARCIERAPEGRAVVPVAVLFADVRGYTALCEQLEPDELTDLVQHFYETSSSALLAHEGLLGQIAGDEIEGIFVPGLAGSNYRRKAVEAARSLVRAVRYTSLEVGIGVASGEEFVGNVGGGGYKDFAAVGDVTNVAARLTSSARDGQIVVDEETYREVAVAVPDAGREELALKGKGAPVPAYWIPP